MKDGDSDRGWQEAEKAVKDYQQEAEKTEAEWTDRIRAIAMLSETEAGLYPSGELERIRAVKVHKAFYPTDTVP
ncbi:hypothetical protein AAVH_13029 [Aphelenchoides avenae]|nr:hypothetical protein AAVH_13027 [Aphelenchus avenae]KAH7719560.1 hypothetical protein AAVH_13028 [Aphelenchus avenae]KAH7719561.1 hypothetical protein AAVH_13029 [Aphelenchus avenae]